MDKLDADILDQRTLDLLNRRIDRVIRDKKDIFNKSFDYDLIEKALEKTLMLQRLSNKDKRIVVTMSKEEMLSIALNFFKSVDKEFFKKAVDVILQQNETLRMNIYNVHKVKDFRARDDWGLTQYDRGAKVRQNSCRAKVYMPTQKELRIEESQSLNKDTCTLYDLYTLVHEISHLFDLNVKNEFKRNNMIDITRELLCETTSTSFEGMLTHYLISKKLFPEDIVKNIYIGHLNSARRSAGLVYAQLVLANEKEKNGKITNEFIKKVMDAKKISKSNVIALAKKIIEKPSDLLNTNRYALGGLISPTIVQAYCKNHQEGVNLLKDYLNYAYNGEFQNALGVYGIEVNEKGIEQLVSNKKQFEKEFERGAMVI